MIVDSILKRQNGIDYSSKTFYNDLKNSNSKVSKRVALTMESGNESEVKKVLCKYIDACGYNKNLISFIKSVNWL